MSLFLQILLQAGDAAAPAAAPEPLDPMALSLGAGTVVKLVLLVLIGMSVTSWFIVGTKGLRMFEASQLSTKFLGVFWGKDEGHVWSTKRLEGIYAQLGPLDRSPLARVFRAGYVELARITSGDKKAERDDLENVERALERAAASEMTQLENQLPFLATTGSTAPFIGLFGTVWGIMTAFLAIGNQRNASLDVVAPGIAEALITTAVGLVAAIPAVMAYNYFVRRIRVLRSEMETFEQDYLNIIKRHFLH